MIIIGEKINGSISSVQEAIQKRDKKKIQELAQCQVEAGAMYLDVCAGTKPEEEEEVLSWLLEVVQEVSSVSLCLDSPNPELLRKMVLLAKRPGILNSISGEGKKAEILFPLMREYGWQAILLTCDDAGIPADAGKKVEIARRLIQQAEQYGIPPERLWIDPLVLAVSAVEDAMLQFIKAVKQIKEEYPSVKITSGLSNVSYGMPARKWINQNFLALALAAGMDSAIMDPTSRDLQGTILAAEVLLGRDHCCRRYNRAYRAGKIGLQRLQRGEKTYEL